MTVVLSFQRDSYFSWNRLTIEQVSQGENGAQPMPANLNHSRKLTAYRGHIISSVNEQRLEDIRDGVLIVDDRGIIRRAERDQQYAA